MVRADGKLSVTYLIKADSEQAARAIAKEICLEQTVELPAALVEGTWEWDNVVGTLESCEACGDRRGAYRAKIAYNEECAGDEMSQLLNLVFGNTSIKPGIQVEDMELNARYHALFPGPRFGPDGLRELCGAPKGRPLVMTALKPMGKSAKQMAERAYALAMGGIDIIKDDDHLSNQRFAPYEERVKLCAEAVARANKETGGKTIYAPCVNAPAHKILERARFAKQAGAGALLVCPGICGFDHMNQLASDPAVGLPLLAHPSLLGASLGGSCTEHVLHGFSHGLLLGTLPRLCGADATIFPNHGGRFSFDKEECLAIQKACVADLGGAKACLPSPGGGMTLSRVGEMMGEFGEDVLLLIGGSVLAHNPDDFSDGARAFMKAAGASPKEAAASSEGKKRKTEENGASEASAPPKKVAKYETALSGDHSKLLKCRSLEGVLPEGDASRWEGVPQVNYKPGDEATWSKISRTELIGVRGETQHFHTRYFEIAPGGFSTLEKHMHGHVVIALKGKGELRIKDKIVEMSLGDVGYTAPWDVHQLTCPCTAKEPFGFVCVVNAARDKPIPLSPGAKRGGA
mmetsp:Transcript_65086/g.190917  ORF Transcript_65086/g.190917 Transcript_65086/m.190917 type:complete len:574 (+) Transcript_65086:72-1793(+)